MYSLLGRSPKLRGVVSLLQRAASALTHLLLLLLELDEEEGVLLNPRKAFSTVGDTVPDPIISIASQLNSSLGRLDGTSLRVPSLFLCKYLDLDNMSMQRLESNDKPLPMGQGCINK